MSSEFNERTLAFSACNVILELLSYLGPHFKLHIKGRGSHSYTVPSIQDIHIVNYGEIKKVISHGFTCEIHVEKSSTMKNNSNVVKEFFANK